MIEFRVDEQKKVVVIQGVSYSFEFFNAMRSRNPDSGILYTIHTEWDDFDRVVGLRKFPPGAYILVDKQ